MPSNLITNPSFETNLTGWANNGTGTITKTQITDGVDGTKAMRIVTDGTVANQGTYFSAPLIATRLGAVLNASIWAKALSGTPPMRLALRIGGAADAFINEYGATAAITGSWAQYNFNHTVIDAASEYIRFKYFVSGTVAIDIAVDLAELYDVTNIAQESGILIPLMAGRRRPR